MNNEQRRIVRDPVDRRRTVRLGNLLRRSRPHDMAVERRSDGRTSLIAPILSIGLGMVIWAGRDEQAESEARESKAREPKVSEPAKVLIGFGVIFAMLLAASGFLARCSG